MGQTHIRILATQEGLRLESFELELSTIGAMCACQMSTRCLIEFRPPTHGVENPLVHNKGVIESITGGNSLFQRP